MRQYYLYYESNQKYVVYDAKTKQITTMEHADWYKLERKYELMQGFDATHKGLNKFSEKFRECIAELTGHKIQLTKHEYFKIDVLYNYKLKQITKYVLEKILGDKLTNHETISLIEQNYSDDCFNAGIMFLDDNFKDQFTKCHTHDYNFHYPKCMSSDKLMIPTKQGKEYKLKELPDKWKLETGYYRVKITCNDKNFMKVFAFSKKNTYVDKSIFWAMMLKEEYPEFKINIELNQELEYNCYLYNKKDCVTGSYLFKKWFDVMSELKESFPKNGIVKFIGSSAHGYIMQRKLLRKTDEQVVEENLDIGISENHRYYVVDKKFYDDTYTNMKYVLIDREHPTTYNIRLKSFLSAHVRNKTARLCTGTLHFGKERHKNVKHDLNDVVRVCVDSVTFRKDMKHLDDYVEVKKETKSTGKIWFKHVNAYYNRDLNEFHGHWKQSEMDEFE